MIYSEINKINIKIVDVKAHVLSIPFKTGGLPYPWMFGPLDQVLVEIVTDQGLTGYGEAFCLGVPFAVASVIEDLLKPILIGLDPTDIKGIQDLMFRKTYLWGRYGITTFAISGVDIALWDIAGKLAVMPIYQLLGGKARQDKLPAYASLLHYSDPNQLEDVAKQAFEDGFKGIKLHQTEVESVKIVRELVGEETPLTVDVNCSWTLEEAIEKAEQMSQYNIDWLEEPIWPPEDFQALAKLIQETNIRLATGESLSTAYQFKNLLDSNSATYIMPSVSKVGGLTEALKIVNMINVTDKQLAPHSFYLGPGLLATAHLLASEPNPSLLEYLYAIPEESIFTSKVLFTDGCLILPDGPGLGIKIDIDVIKEYGVKNR